MWYVFQTSRSCTVAGEEPRASFTRNRSSHGQPSVHSDPQENPLVSDGLCKASFMLL